MRSARLVLVVLLLICGCFDAPPPFTLEVGVSEVGSDEIRLGDAHDGDRRLPSDLPIDSRTVEDWSSAEAEDRQPETVIEIVEIEDVVETEITQDAGGDIPPDAIDAADLLADAEAETSLVDGVVEAEAQDCPEPCDGAGMLACNEDGAVVECADVEGCLVWLAPEPCLAGMVCICSQQPAGVCLPPMEPCKCLGECGENCGDCADGWNCVEDAGVGTCVPDCDALCQGRDCGDPGTQGVCDCGVCDDAKECTEDSCDDGLGKCLFENLPDLTTPCWADGDGCTDEVCFSGNCIVAGAVDCGPPSTECFDTQCVSSNPVFSTCVETPLPSKPCDDGLFCQVASICDPDGNCGGGVPLDCSGDGGQCKDSSCDEDADACVVGLALEDDTPCNADDDGCTVDDSCQLGECTAGDSPSCSDLDEACKVGICQSGDADSYSCVAESVPDGDPCEDGQFCTVGEVCNEAGACVGGVANDCGKGGQCVEVTCDENKGTCKATPVADGTVCDDDEACTLADLCQIGQCVGFEDVCGGLRVNTHTKHVGATPMAGSHLAAHLGFGRLLSVWRSGEFELRGRLVDATHSMMHPELELTETWDGVEAACETRLTSQALAVNPLTHDFMLVSGYKYAKIYRTAQNMKCNASVHYAMDLAVYDRSGELVKEQSTVGSPAQLWYANKQSTGGAFADYECGCGNYPGDFNPNDITWAVPDLADTFDDHVAAVAYSDGTFGIIRRVETIEADAMFFPVDEALNVGAPVDNLGDIFSPAACVSPLDDKLLLVYEWGNGNIGGSLLDKGGAAFTAKFPVASLAPDHLDAPFCVGLDYGRFVVTHSNCENAGPCDAHLQVLNHDGGLLGTATSLSGPLAGSQLPTANPVVIAGDTLGIPWQDGAAGDPVSKPQAGIFEVHEDGSAVGTSYPLNSGAPGKHYWPALVEVDGELGAFWAKQPVQDQRNIFFRKLNTAGDGIPSSAPEKRANSITAGVQEEVALTALDDGRFAAAWTSQNLSGGADTDIAFRIFSSSGEATAPEVRVNNKVASHQYEPTVMYNPAKQQFVVAWTELSGPDGSKDVKARLLDADGIPLAEEFTASIKTEDDQFRPRARVFPDGSFAVVFTGYKSQGYLDEVYFRVFDPDGTPLTGIIDHMGVLMEKDMRMNYSVGQYQDHGEMVVLGADPWVSLAVSARYSENGKKPLLVSTRTLTVAAQEEGYKYTGSPFKGDVDISLDDDPGYPSLASHPDGGLMVCWVATTGVHCQRLDDTPSMLGSAFTLIEADSALAVDLEFTGANSLWAVVDLANTADGPDRGLVRYHFDLNGQQLSQPILVNQFIDGNQLGPVVCPLAGGETVIAWTSDGQDGDAGGIYFRVFD